MKFEDLCPRWAITIKEELQYADKSCMNYDRCIVGEAYGFSDDYKFECNECRKRAELLVNDMWNVDSNGRRRMPGIVVFSVCGENLALLEYNHKQLKRQINGFMRHWNKVHKS